MVTGRAIGHLINDKDIGVPGSRKVEVPDREWSIGGGDLDLPVILARKSSANAVAL
jgi:hypothetical protein